jgi:hypothetical protein
VGEPEPYGGESGRRWRWRLASGETLQGDGRSWLDELREARRSGTGSIEAEELPNGWFRVVAVEPVEELAELAVEPVEELAVEGEEIPF